MYWPVWMYIECLEAERIWSPTHRFFHRSAVSEPSLRAMSTFTAGSLQVELPALSCVVQFILVKGSSLGPRYQRNKGWMACSIQNVTLMILGSILHKHLKGETRRGQN